MLTTCSVLVIILVQCTVAIADGNDLDKSKYTALLLNSPSKTNQQFELRYIT